MKCRSTEISAVCSTNLQSPSPACSEAIRIGAVPSGFPSTICLLNHCRSFTTITAKTSRSNSPRMPNANATYGRLPRRFHAAWSASFCATAPAAVPSRAEPKSCKTILIGATWFCFTNTFTATAERAWAPAIKPGGPAWSRNSSSKAENNVPPLEFREAIPGDETVLLPRRLYRRVVHRSQPGKWVSMPFISKSTAATIRRWNFIAAPAIKITTAY